MAFPSVISNSTSSTPRMHQNCSFLHPFLFFFPLFHFTPLNHLNLVLCPYKKSFWLILVLIYFYCNVSESIKNNSCLFPRPNSSQRSKNENSINYLTLGLYFTLFSVSISTIINILYFYPYKLFTFGAKF